MLIYTHICIDTHKRRLFYSIYCGNLVEVLEVNLTMLWGPHYGWVPLEVFTLRLVHTKPLVIHQLQFRFSSPCADSHGGFCSSKLWFSISAWLSLQFGGHWFALWAHRSDRSNKSFWVFSLFSFLLVVRMWWQFPSSLHAKLETGRIFHFFDLWE